MLSRLFIVLINHPSCSFYAKLKSYKVHNSLHTCLIIIIFSLQWFNIIRSTKVATYHHYLTVIMMGCIVTILNHRCQRSEKLPRTTGSNLGVKKALMCILTTRKQRPEWTRIEECFGFDRHMICVMIVFKKTRNSV